MGVNVKVTIDRRALAKVAADVSDASAQRAARVARDRARSNIERKDRVATGAMKRSIRIWRRPTASERDRYAVGTTLFYAVYQEEGTRAHGPVVAKFLRFTPKRSTKVVFAKWVRGVKPARFLRDAHRSLKASDFLP